MQENFDIENELLRQIAEGDERAFSIFFHRYNARIYPFILKITKSPDISEEIIQEVFLRAWVNRVKLPELDKPDAWLFRIAVNLSFSHLRNKANDAAKHAELAKNTEQVVNELNDTLDMRELSHLVEEAVSQLPTRRQAIFRLSRYEGLTHRQIAEKLGISQNTVKDHMVIAAKFIKEYIRTRSGFSLGILILVKII